MTACLNTCIQCGKQFNSPRPRKFCSKKCSNNHYRKAEHLCTCTICGKQFNAYRPGCTTCSNACKAKKTAQSHSYQQAMHRRRKAQQGTLFTESELNKRQRWLQSLTPLRRAWELHDSAEFFSQLKANSTIDDRGCWNWRGGIDRSGYPYASLNRPKAPLHRASLEMRYGKPLGTQQAHHICGNSHCVNPNHLAPATNAANIGEMLARQSYESRIKELENELRRIDPQNELLNRISYGQRA